LTLTVTFTVSVDQDANIPLVSPVTGCVPVWSGQLSPNFPEQIGGVGRETSQVGFYIQKSAHHFTPLPKKRDCGSFQSLAPVKVSWAKETAIFFDRRTLRETGRIGSCGSRSDEAETPVNKTTPVPITPRGPVVTLDTVHNRNKTAQDGLLGLQIFIITLYNKC
jgi:hypothetical protein